MNLPSKLSPALPHFQNRPTFIYFRNDHIRPEWFASPHLENVPPGLRSVPFGQTFPDDVHWLHLLSSGKEFVGRCDFEAAAEGEDLGKLLRYWFASV